jgi:hypothetical protein
MVTRQPEERLNSPHHEEIDPDSDEDERNVSDTPFTKPAHSLFSLTP